MLNKRAYCLKCSPFGTRNIRESSNKIKKIILYRCDLCHKIKKKKTCRSCFIRVRRYWCRKASIKYLGGRCNRCGWSGLECGYDFHHLNPKEKDFQISCAADKNWDTVKKELDKCELLCALCHRIEHSIYNDNRFKVIANKYDGHYK